MDLDEGSNAATPTAPSKRRKVHHHDEASSDWDEKKDDESFSESGINEAMETSKYPDGTTISKLFGDEVFSGKIIGYDPVPKYYRVKYEDDDEEDLSEDEVSKLLTEMQNTKSPKVKVVKKKKTNSQQKNQAKTAVSNKKRKKEPAATSDKENVQETSNKRASQEAMSSSRYGRRTRKVVSYVMESSDESEPETSSSEDIVAKKKKRRSSSSKPKKAAARGKGKRKAHLYSDDESDASIPSSSPEEETDDDLLFEAEEDKDDELLVSSSEDEAPKRKRKGNKKASVPKTASDSAKPEKKKMCDSFEPFNAPLYKEKSLQEIHEAKEFLDPCGMEATDDVIERLVGEQVDKIGSVLQRTLRRKDAMGSLECPLRLGTACSGTDAPSLALTLVQEQMELKGLGDGLFNYTHEFSCENDPFKQAYLARNFDSKLYPDIAKLTDDDPRDVYGQIQEIPPFNLFVAGTSCKNFSMLRSNRRIDIEDKGCSGETFLAATEVLFEEKPSFAIFENVNNAPWAKMQEYITGRVKLSECDSSKAIKNIKDKKKELTFVLDKEDNIVVDTVPSVYGVRCGAVVAGYLKSGSTKLHTIQWPSGSKKSCTLSDLIKKNKISKQDDTLVFETECTYCTHIKKVDTKDYGLPQTRQRVYMFVWRPDDDDVNDDLGEYWEHIVKHLESPVRHSLQAFILQVDHEDIRVFREALDGPAGRQTRRSVYQEPDFWTSANANLPHNKNTRQKLGMQDMARSLTSWGAFGQKQIPPHYWLEYLKITEQRRTDLLDILHASAARDAEAHDSSHSSYFWNLSQNASKEKHRSACPGIAGCITPGGDAVLPHEGRPLLGCEKLLVQGIPYFRLLLGNETEVQLGDLAGNAMSLTVVCATMLAALTCKELRTETLESDHKNANRILSESSSLEGYTSTPDWRDVVRDNKKADLGKSLQSSGAMSFFQKLASLAPAAVKSSIWCTCETSGSNSLSTEFLECKVCRVSCCRSCVCTTAGYQLQSHDTVDVSISPEDHSLGKFQAKLRDIVPPSLFFTKEGFDDIANTDNDRFRSSGLSNYTFSLHRIKRDRKKWLIIYYARENHGIGEAVAEFRITVGELKREDVGGCSNKQVEIGMKGELTSFQTARTKPLVYGPLEPCAIITVRHGERNSGSHWKVKSADTTTSLLLRGAGATDSFRIEVGLTDVASNALQYASKQKSNIKHFKAATKRGEERRWVYPKNWKVWPEKISIDVDADASAGPAEAICGTYERAPCRQTTNQSALWIRKATADKPSLYILIKPNSNRTGPDTAIVTSSISHNDACCILAVLPRDWQPCDALKPELHKLDNVQLMNWSALTRMECRVPVSSISIDSPADSPDVLVAVSGLNSQEVTMLCRGHDASGSESLKLNVTRGQKAQQTVRVFNSVCVAPIQTHAARTDMKYDLSPDAKWTLITPSDREVPFGCCPTTVPPRPTEEWAFDEDRRAWERRSEPGASRAYYVALQDAPQPFELWVEKPAQKLTVKYFPKVVAHQAARQLIEGRGEGLHDEVLVQYRLADVTQQSDPVITPFKVSNCDLEQATSVSLRGEHKLYERQQKVVTKMLAIENSKTEFEELEMSEHDMPGSTGLSLVAKATRNAKICGGVIADAIGAGKTVISIAIILSGLKKARASRSYPNKSGATLVLVPPALILQWESEIHKFSQSLEVILVFDYQSLKELTLKQIIESDVVITTVDILEAKGYMERLVSAAKLGKKVTAQLPSYDGQIEQTGAKGRWVPASSADPYAGANNSNNQKRRNQSAHYTYVYDKCIQKVREREFQEKDKGVPLEYFEWERVIVDEIHESLCTTRSEINLAKEQDMAKSNGGSVSAGFYKEKNRRAGRELLGISQKDIRRRPLIFRRAIFGLTGTPLLDSSSRVIELANLMGNTYVIGLSSHWRKLEKESCCDIFLHNYLEPKQSREVRKNIFSKCQDFLRVACCRNKAGEEMDGIELVQHRRVVRMTEEEKSLYLKSQSGISPSKQSLSIKPEDFDPSAGHDISKFLKQNGKFKSRGKELVEICKEILGRKGDEHTKIIVFTDGRIGAGAVARDFLCADDAGLGCTWLDRNDTNEVNAKKISWYQSGDATEEDRARPRVLVLHFDHAAGLNLQAECHNLILFTPLYVGEGGSSSDPVADASTELQAIGRVYRAGQTRQHVNVYRIELQGPNGEECVDGQLIRRNTDEETVSMAVNAGD